MALPSFPQSVADYVSGLTGDDFTTGGHRTNFIPTAQGTLTFADYCRLVALELLELAEQVAADADSAAAGSGTEASIANIRTGESAQYLSIRRIYEANEPVALDDGSSIAWDMGAGINFSVTLGAAGRALANPTNKVAGKSGLLIVKQDGTGDRSIASYGSDYIWIGGQPFWPDAPNARSLVTYFVESDGKVLLTFGGSTS